MESKIISRNKNPFLQREELLVEIRQNITPNKAEAIKAVGGDEKTTVIRKIHSHFGRNSFLIEARVYENVQAREKIETIPKKIRKKMEADRIAAEAAAKKEAEEAKKKVGEETKSEKIKEREAPKE